MWKYARPSEINFRSTSTTQSYALAPLSHTARAITGRLTRGVPHVGERTEKQLIGAFCDKIAKLTPQLVTFNGNSFDLPDVALYDSSGQFLVLCGEVKLPAIDQLAMSIENKDQIGRYLCGDCSDQPTYVAFGLDSLSISK
jgi:hypothetical protein